MNDGLPIQPNNLQILLWLQWYVITSSYRHKNYDVVTYLNRLEFSCITKWFIKHILSNHHTSLPFVSQALTMVVQHFLPIYSTLCTYIHASTKFNDLKLVKFKVIPNFQTLCSFWKITIDLFYNFCHWRWFCEFLKLVKIVWVHLFLHSIECVAFLFTWDRILYGFLLNNTTQAMNKSIFLNTCYFTNVE